MKKLSLALIFVISLFAQSTSALSPSEDCYYTITSTSITYCDKPITGVDLETFKVDPSKYAFATDKNHAYFGEKIISGANPSTFSAIDEDYAKDATHIFCYEKTLSTDVANFKRYVEIDPNMWDTNIAMDSNSVYYNCDKLPNSDPKTFTIIRTEIPEYYSHFYYYKDKNQAYSDGLVIQGADPSSFQPIDPLFSKDSGHIFCYETTLTTDVQNFKKYVPPEHPLWPSRFSLDSNSVYIDCTKLENSDSKTFVAFENDQGYEEFSKDKNNAYFEAQKLAADATTFKEIGRHYASDNTQVFYKNLKISGTETKSFKINLFDEVGKHPELDAECGNLAYDAYDDKGCYWEGIKVIARDSNPTLPAKRSKPYFTDINSPSLDYLFERGIFIGYQDNSFGFNKPLTRAELIKIVMVADIITDSAKNLNCFSDVKAGDWYAPYICKAKEEGIIDGYPDGTYKPNNTVNKVEAIKMISKGKSSDLSPDLTPFTDIYKNQWYYEYVVEALNSHFIDLTFDRKLNPGLPIMRQEAAEILFRKLVDRLENGSHGFNSQEELDLMKATFLNGNKTV